MTKSGMIDQVLLKVSGGKLSPDVNVWREDIEHYLPAVIAAVINQDAEDKLDQELRRARVSRDMVIRPHGTQYSLNYVLTVQHDDERQLHYVIPPGRLLRLSQQKGLNMVGPLNGAPYIIVSGQAETIGLEVVDQVFAWVEDYTDEDRIMLTSMNPEVNSVITRLTLNPDSLTDSTLLPIPEYLEVAAVEMLSNFFLEQRQTPADGIVNKSDVNEA